MSDTDLRKEFIRIDETAARVQILVRRISWDGPATPVSDWVVGRELPEGATETEVEEALTLLLENSEYFRECAECRERNPVGWMHDERICQGCAQRNHGVVY